MEIVSRNGRRCEKKFVSVALRVSFELFVLSYRGFVAMKNCYRLSFASKEIVDCCDRVMFDVPRS